MAKAQIPGVTTRGPMTSAATGALDEETTDARWARELLTALAILGLAAGLSLLLHRM